MKSRLLYQMDGGTALITFEEDVGEFRVTGTQGGHRSRPVGTSG